MCITDTVLKWEEVTIGVSVTADSTHFHLTLHRLLQFLALGHDHVDHVPPKKAFSIENSMIYDGIIFILQ